MTVVKSGASPAPSADRTGSAAVPAQAAGSGASPDTSLSHSARSNRPIWFEPAFTVWTYRPSSQRMRRVSPPPEARAPRVIVAGAKNLRLARRHILKQRVGAERCEPGRAAFEFQLDLTRLAVSFSASLISPPFLH